MDLLSRNPANALLPEQFGKYSLLGHLATGGMAEVWLARQVGIHGFEKIVVIKRARPELTDRETTQLFLDEARLVATLQHPNIAQVYEIGTAGGSYFFVMEYVDGADLRRLIEAAIAKHHAITLADALYIISHVCTALHYAHEKHDLEGRPLHIIHRDVSPSNVLISRDGAIKVCDFGVAKARNSRAETTQNGVLKGKFSYMSPEQCQSKPLDRRSDVFSIGILLYELSTLTKLFRANSDFALLQHIAEARIPPPSSRMPDYPPELEHIVMKALARDPADRYPTAQALQLDLEDFAREHKLAMSSIRVARLMAVLFEKPSDAWIRAHRAHRDQLESAPTAPPSELPIERDDDFDDPGFVAIGSAPVGGTNDTPALRRAPTASSMRQGIRRPGSNVSRVNRMPRGSTNEAYLATANMVSPLLPGTGVSATRDTMMPQVSAQRTSALWLVSAVIAGVLAVGVTVADQMIAAEAARSIRDAVASDVERIASVFDTAARSAHLRADGIATTPMLRAAIETDAATLSDLASSEMVFTAGNGESLEVFQLGGASPISLLRIPRTAPALEPLKGRETRISSDGRALTLLASVPIAGYRPGQVGGIVMATPIDLSAVQRALAEHTVQATLKGIGADLTLVAPPAGAPVRAAAAEIAVPSTGDWKAGSTVLAVIPKPAVGLVWGVRVRNACGGLSAVLLLGFAVSLVRRPRA